MLQHKYDFKVVFSVKDANPNGDPLNGNRPRQDIEGRGEVSDVAIKRKIRNVLQAMGEKIFVQSDDRSDDGFHSLKDRAEANEELAEVAKNKDSEQYAKVACKEWFDVRAFGQLFAFKKGKKGEGVSVGVRGPVSIQMARSITPVDIAEMQITKSVNSEPGAKPSSDRMGMKYFVDYGVYVFNGSISPQLADKTGFSDEDAEKLHQALIHLFEGDESSARPAGSMEVLKVYWWKHDSKLGKVSSAEVHRSVKVSANGDAEIAMRSADELAIDESKMITDPKPEIFTSISLSE